jgi:hypothetical protein
MNKKKMMFKVMCSKCGNKMNYEPRGLPVKKVKKCVYCGFSFVVHSGGNNTRIIKRIK